MKVIKIIAIVPSHSNSCFDGVHPVHYELVLFVREQLVIWWCCPAKCIVLHPLCVWDWVVTDALSSVVVID